MVWGMQERLGGQEALSLLLDLLEKFFAIGEEFGRPRPAERISEKVRYGYGERG